MLSSTRLQDFKDIVLEMLFVPNHANQILLTTKSNSSISSK